MQEIGRRRREAAFLAAGLFGFASLAYYWYYYVKNFCKKPKVYVSDGALKALLEKGVPNLFLPYRPSPWLLNSHLMTVAGVLRRFGGDCYERQLVTMSDGGTVGLDWFADSQEADRWDPSTPIVLVMHGITGGSHEGYCRWMCTTAYQQKWRAVVLNYRGCNGLRLSSPLGYSPVITDDVHSVIHEIKWRYPNAPLFAVAYSLGSLMLCKYLGESDQGKGSQVDGAVMPTLDNPLDFQPRHYLQVWAVRPSQEHKEDFADLKSVTVEDVRGCRTIQDFEQVTVCPMFGFGSLEEYRSRGSSQFHIPHIKTKSLILVAEDDPFIGKLPIQECLENNNTVLAVTSYGGHVAFLQGLWPFGRAWMEDTTMQFFQTCLLPTPDLAPSRTGDSFRQV